MRTTKTTTTTRRNCLASGGAAGGDDIVSFRFIHPSGTIINSTGRTTGTGIHTTPNITVDGNIYSSNSPHLVIVPTPKQENENEDEVQILRVLLPGTTAYPEKFTCLLKSLASSSSSDSAAAAPVIGLSYAFLNASDAERNQLCHQTHHYPQEEDWTKKCLENQHLDDLWGTTSTRHNNNNDNNNNNNNNTDDEFYTSNTTLWSHVEFPDSIVGRLVNLLHFLIRNYPNEQRLWRNYLLINNSTGNTTVQPNWERIWVLGHSQGASHAAYLAMSKKLAGVGLLSGPQDDCSTGTSSSTGDGDGGAESVVPFPCWIDRPFQTSNIRALAHKRESATNIIQENWIRMFGNTTKPFIVDDTQVRMLPTDRPWLTEISPQPNATCEERPFHCSTGLDDNSPLLLLSNDNNRSNNNTKENPYLYAPSVWPQLAGLEGAVAAVPNKSGGEIEDDRSSSSVARVVIVSGVYVLFMVVCHRLYLRIKLRSSAGS